MNDGTTGGFRMEDLLENDFRATGRPYTVRRREVPGIRCVLCSTPHYLLEDLVVYRRARTPDVLGDPRYRLEPGSDPCKLDSAAVCRACIRDLMQMLRMAREPID